jgi:hypothetical protein
VLQAGAELAYVAIESEQGPRDAPRLSKVLSEVSVDFAPGFELSEDEDVSEDEDETVEGDDDAP